MRHLNLEAAKMVKYGGVSETQALAMITINPARELGLDGRLGSIEVGKDADIVLFNGHPFDAFSRCELALIDGEVYFQRREPDGGFARPARRAHGDARGRRGRRGTASIEIAAQPKSLFALVGANLHPVSGPGDQGRNAGRRRRQDRGDRPGRHADPARSPDDRVSGLDIWPGMVDAGSTLGLFEIGSLRETQDFADAAHSSPSCAAAPRCTPTASTSR